MASEARYRLLYDEVKPIVRIKFGLFAWTTVSIPLFAFIFCVVYSVLYDFEKATFSHCRVYNVLPSISAAIGNFSPQAQVWQVAIALHAIPRFCVASVYYQYHASVIVPGASCLYLLAFFLNIVENIALIILSFWTSSDNYPVHKTSFITFIIMSELYMILVWKLHKTYRRLARSVAETRSLKWKRRLLTLNILCILIATYFFIRHNMWCEQYVYSAFAFFEYMVVLSNMAFHMTAYLDFHDRALVIYKWGVYLQQR